MLGRIQGGAPPSALPGGGQPGPAAAPMSTPEKKEGKREKAHLQVHIGMNMLEQAISTYGSETKEGKVILNVLTKLATTFGENDTSDLTAAEMAEMVTSMPQTGGGTQQQQALMKMSQGARPAQFPPRPAPMPMPGAPA